jgi:ribonuclease HII
MPWQVGIDEAGYGPNLGPLVQAAVAVRVPEGIDDLWVHGTEQFRKAKGKEDRRLLVDDSKKVNEGVHGLAKLERSVFGFLDCPVPVSLEDLLLALGDESQLAEGREEPWFLGGENLPVVQPMNVIATAREVRRSLETVQWAVPRVRMRTPKRFNQMLDRYDLKSTVLIQGVIELLRGLIALPGDEPIHIAVDKLGGRNYYAPMLQAAFPESWPRAVCESNLECTYSLPGLPREVQITFQPKADSRFFCVALASLVAKYLREIAMRQFNAFWEKLLPGLQPTAGYPVDALRFMEQIEPLLENQNLTRDAIWRRK